MRGVSLTHPELTSFLCGEFLLHIPSWLLFYVGSFCYTSRADFFFMWGVSLTHPMLPSFWCGEFLLHILSWLLFYVGSFSYTSRAGCFWCEELLSSAVYSEDNPLRKELGASGPRRKVNKKKVTLRPVKEALEQSEQSRTKPNKNWVKSGHRNERGSKEMDLSSK